MTNVNSLDENNCRVKAGFRAAVRVLVGQCHDVWLTEPVSNLGRIFHSNKVVLHLL